MTSILFIDDDQFVTALYKGKLQSEGFVVETAHTGTEALTKLDRTSPDLIILDLNIPDFNGVEILQLVRSTQHLQHTPVIIFSNGYIQKLVEAVKEMGVNKILTKAQCPPGKLLSEVKEILGEAEQKPASLAAVATASPQNFTTEDLPALLDSFHSLQDTTGLHSALVRIYKAAGPYIITASKAGENTAQKKLGGILEKLFEDLYAHPEHLTDSTKQTLSAGLQKLSQFDNEKSAPALESERALKNILQSFDG